MKGRKIYLTALRGNAILLMVVDHAYDWWLWTEKGAHRGPLVRALRYLGQASLVLYVYHHLVRYRLFWLPGWTGKHTWHGEYGVFSHCGPACSCAC